MSSRLESLLDPTSCALVLQEVQNGVVGEHAVFQELADVARSIGLVDQCAKLADAARRGNIPVFHCTAATRSDRIGANANALLFHAARKAGAILAPGSPGVEVPTSIGVEDRDVVLPRHHGLGPLTGTQLDPMLRNAGVTTIVAAGVSLNVGMLDLVITAVNLGYKVVLPTDAVAGVPREYGDAVLANTMNVLATLTTTDAVTDIWAIRPIEGDR